MRVNDLTVIVPAYNSMPYCRDFIESVTSQDFGEFEVEVLLIDDGSDDGTAEFFDSVANDYSYFRVIHQPNSGSPSGPRNLGIEEADSEYIFFADSDDMFVGNAIAKMLDAAYLKNCDILIPRIDGSDWGITYGGMFECSLDNCTVKNSPILNSLGPYKLFRKSLIMEHGIRFPYDIAYEDLPFSLEAYLNASSISILADDVMYKYVKRDDGKSLSQSGIDESSIFRKLSSKVKGIKYYLEICKKYYSQLDCPDIYVRAYRYATRLYEKESFVRDPELFSILQSALSEQYEDCLRGLLPFSLLVSSDAFTSMSRDRYMEYLSKKQSTKIVSCTSDDWHYYQVFDSLNELLFDAPFPARPGIKLLNSGYKRIALNGLLLCDGFLWISGSCEMMYQSTLPVEKCVIECRTKKNDCVFEVGVNNHDETHNQVYPGTWFSTVDWEARVPIDEVDDSLFDSNGMERLDFWFIARCSSFERKIRLGMNYANGVQAEFLSKNVVSRNTVVKPHITDLNNVSLLLDKYENVNELDDEATLTVLEWHGETLRIGAEIIIRDPKVSVGSFILIDKNNRDDIVIMTRVDFSKSSFRVKYSAEFPLLEKLSGMGAWALELVLFNSNGETLKSIRCLSSNKSRIAFQTNVISKNGVSFVPKLEHKRVCFLSEEYSERKIHAFECFIQKLDWISESKLSIEGRVFLPGAHNPSVEIMVEPNCHDGSRKALAFLADCCKAEDEHDKWTWHAVIDLLRLQANSTSFRLPFISKGIETNWKFGMSIHDGEKYGYMRFGYQRAKGTLDTFKSGRFTRHKTLFIPGKDDEGYLCISVIENTNLR